MKAKIRLDTLTDIKTFVDITSNLNCRVLLTDGLDFVVSAKSLMGAICSMEWENVYCTSDKDIYTLIKKFIIED